MAVATYEDVAVALGRPISTEAEQAQVEWWLSGVELFIIAPPRAVSPSSTRTVVQVRRGRGRCREDPPRTVRDESSITVSVDDGSVTRRYENAISAERHHRRVVEPARPGHRHRPVSVRPYFEPDTVRWPVSTPPAYDPFWDSFVHDAPDCHRGRTPLPPPEAEARMVDTWAIGTDMGWAYVGGVDVQTVTPLFTTKARLKTSQGIVRDVRGRRPHDRRDSPRAAHPRRLAGRACERCR